MALSNRLGWIGVDIGTRCVKLAQVVRSPAGVRLRHSAVVQRSIPWTDAESLAFAKPNDSHVEIRAALECSEFKGRKAACLLPMNVCELRGISIPNGDDHERRAMIANELADDWADLPFPMDFDYWELEVDRNSSAADVFNVDVVAVARPWISQVAGDCKRARLDCWAVDGGPLAMARAVTFATPQQSAHHVLAVDWGFSNTTICVVGGGRPLYARRMHRCSFRRGLEAIENTLGVTLDNAQHLADKLGVLSSGEGVGDHREIQDAVTAALAEPVTELVGEIERTLRFFELQRHHLRPASICLMGGGASVRNIGLYLSQRLDLPVRIWDLPVATPANDRTHGTHASLFGTAAALSALAWRAV